MASYNNVNLKLRSSDSRGSGGELSKNKLQMLLFGKLTHNTVKSWPQVLSHFS